MRELSEFFAGKTIKRFDTTLQKKALRRLRYIDAAEKINDLRIPPSNRLEKKAGDLRGFYANPRTLLKEDFLDDMDIKPGTLARAIDVDRTAIKNIIEANAPSLPKCP